jgi:hypothetical protein
VGHRGIDEAWEKLLHEWGCGLLVQERQTCDWVTADLWHYDSWEVTAGERFTDVSEKRAASICYAKRKRQYVFFLILLNYTKDRNFDGYGPDSLKFAQLFSSTWAG